MLQLFLNVILFVHECICRNVCVGVLPRLEEGVIVTEIGVTVFLVCSIGAGIQLQSS